MGRYGVQAVRIEARFAVGEYEIVILSADDALALDRWLRDNKYRIPEGAEASLRPYVAAGSKFFVAKVNSKLVKFENGRARLSPLRFHYDADTFSLPVRLGLLNSSGHQDLVVHILGKKRYDVVNYPKATLSTNLEVDDAVRSRFGELYAAVFDRTLAEHPGAVVTEYAWSSGSCDPCPTPALTSSELQILGADTLGKGVNEYDWVLTRLHARYTKDQLGADLVFAEAPAIEGGREDGSHSTEAKPTTTMTDNFQTRFIIRHPWTGPIACAYPDRGNWGPPPGNRSRLPPKMRDPGVVRGKLDLAKALKSKLDLPKSYLDEPDPRPGRIRSMILGAGLAIALVIALAIVMERAARTKP
jgi:hypothetical protein